MMGLFQSFIGGMEAGEDHRQRRTQRTALDEAGQLYGLGKTDAAENVLVGARMPDVAANYSALGEARRARQTRRNVATAMQGAGQSATDQASAASNAAIEAGDPELALQFRHEASQLSAEDRQRRAADHEQAAQIALTILPTVPMEQRAERMVQETMRMTGANEEEVRRNVANLDLSDEGLQALGQSALSIGDIYAGRERQQRYAVEDSQFDRSLAAQREGRYAITASQARQYGNDYQREQSAITDDLGPQVMSAMPWAMQVAASGAPPNGATNETTLVNDQGMLRAVARLQTGVGVLTDNEVRGTLGNNIANRLQEAGATFMLTERLRPEVRQALGQLVQTGVQRAASLAWSRREDAILEYQSASGGRDPVGWSLPAIAHPEDFDSLRSVERMAGSNNIPALRPNDVRIAPSGREYTYFGPGNWTPRAEGNNDGYRAARDARLQRGGAPDAANEEAPRPGAPIGWAQMSPGGRLAAVRAVRNNPALRAEFESRYGVDFDEAEASTPIARGGRGSYR